MTKKNHISWKNVLFLLLFFGILYYQLRSKGNLNEVWANFLETLHSKSPVWLLAAILLMPVNYGLEMVKWQLLCRPFEKLSFSKAAQAVLAGVNLGVITPARLGEYGGRMLGISKSNKGRAVLAMAFGSWVQLVIIFWVGLASLVFLDEKVLSPIVSARGFWVVAVAVGILLTGAMLRFFPLIKRLLLIGRFAKKWAGVLLFRYDRRQVLLVILLTLGRFLVYSTQFYLLNVYFGLPSDPFIQYPIIFTVFLIQTFLPVPALLGLLIKSETALFLWSAYGVNEISIISGTFFLWLINAVLPALPGLYFANKLITSNYLDTRKFLP